MFPKLIIAFLLITPFFSVHGQKVKTTTYTLNIQAAKLQSDMDSISLISNLHIAGLEYDLPKLNPVKFQHNKRVKYYWWLRHAGLNSRLLIKTTLLPSDTLFIYDEQQELKEFFTIQDVHDSIISTEPVSQGQQLVLSSSSAVSNLQIIKMSAEPIVPFKSKNADFGDSGNCQVNTNCAEGKLYEESKRSVIKILIRHNNILAFCSGSLINNTSFDYSPYLLTAEHCGLLNNNFVDPTDMALWTFYFNYESPNCQNPPSENSIPIQKLTGATWVARSFDDGGEYGSDFLLLRLSSAIPVSYNAYYAGWNRSAKDIPYSGASIHHPQGDIKKISTYYYPPLKSSFGESIDYNTHWVVNWGPGLTNWATTESGSSGAPLFDEQQLIRGQLTGGASSCANPDGEDYFGMMNFNWDGNGTAAEYQLQPWLDPLGTGTLALSGGSPGITRAPDFPGDFHILPSPASDYIEISELDNNQQTSYLLITDIRGKIVYERTAVDGPGIIERISVKNWQQGIYIAYLYQENILKTKKFSVW